MDPILIIILSEKSRQKNLKKQITCVGRNIERFITFAIPIESEATRINKNVAEFTKNISYILQFIDSARFMAS